MIGCSSNRSDKSCSCRACSCFALIIEYTQLSMSDLSHAKILLVYVFVRNSNIPKPKGFFTSTGKYISVTQVVMCLWTDTNYLAPYEGGEQLHTNK